MRALLHNRVLFLIFRSFFQAFLFLRLRVRTRPAGKLQTPCLVLANHTTNWDPMILGSSFPMLLHYLASDHIFRWGLASRIIVRLGDPIPRLKATTEVASTKRILQKLRIGESVCIFPEGNRTWSGESIEIPATIGKLAKKAAVTTVIYRIEGGYFSSPRWSSHLRRGKVSGHISRVFSPEEIEGMTAQELGEAIQRALYVNAYEDQEKHPVAFRGKDIAEELELALYLCPECGGIGTLQSKGDRFSCPCGLALRYTVYGNFEPLGEGAAPFPNVLAWFRWQQEKMPELVGKYLTSQEAGPMYRDPEQNLMLVERATDDRPAGQGILEAHRENLRLLCEDGSSLSFPWGEIADMAIHGPKVLVFSTVSGESYEVRTKARRSPVKYLDTYHAIKNMPIRHRHPAP